MSGWTCDDVHGRWCRPMMDAEVRTVHNRFKQEWQHYRHPQQRRRHDPINDQSRCWGQLEGDHQGEEWSVIKCNGCSRVQLWSGQPIEDRQRWFEASHADTAASTCRTPYRTDVHYIKIPQCYYWDKILYVYIDIDIIIKFEDKIREELYSDGVHLNWQGVQIFSKALASHILKSFHSKSK